MVALTVALAVLAALAVDWLTADSGLLPPAFAPQDPSAAWRRSLAIAALTLVLWVGVFGPLALVGVETPESTEPPSPVGLFLLHGLFAAFLVAWAALGYTGRNPLATLWKQLGLATRDVGREAGIGVAAGIAAWFAVLCVMLLIGLLLVALGEEDLVPQAPPEMLPWVVGLPVGIRVLISLSAGVFEELFFRGYLQPRAGVGISTAFFVLAHASYEQPFMLIGVAILSLVFAALTWWRQNVWPAIVAHAVFDAVQLLIVVPRALEWLEKSGS